MTYRIDEIDIPSDRPFENDQLGREGVVTFLAELIGRTGGPFVLAIDAPWGNGKTTLVRMLKAVLEQSDYKCVYFNAWQVDYVTDPLVALVSSLVELKLTDPSSQNIFFENIKSLRKVTSLLAKRGTVALAKALTPGGLDLQEEIRIAKEEFNDDPLVDIIDSFLSESHLLSTFRSELESSVSNLPNVQSNKPLIFFIDELDRCRPSFTIELLERVKHLFNVPNVFFVLSIDKSQLEASTAAVYGSRINAPEYLRRFIDIEFGIPVMSGNDFTSTLLTKFDMDAFFIPRAGELRYDKVHFIEMFSKLAEVCDLTLRVQERCMTRLKVVLDQTRDNQYLDPILVAFLIILRTINRELFAAIHNDELSFENLKSFLESFPKGGKFLETDLGIMLEAYFIWMDVNHERFEAKMNLLRELGQVFDDSNPERLRGRQLISYIQGMGGRGGRRPNMSFVAKKIDIAANIRD